MMPIVPEEDLLHHEAIYTASWIYFVLLPQSLSNKSHPELTTTQAIRSHKIDVVASQES